MHLLMSNVGSLQSRVINKPTVCGCARPQLRVRWTCPWSIMQDLSSKILVLCLLQGAGSQSFCRSSTAGTDHIPDKVLPPPSVARHAYKLKRMVTYELATRAQYEEALRHYQVAVKEMRSPDRYDASQAWVNWVMEASTSNPETTESEELLVVIRFRCCFVKVLSNVLNQHVLFYTPETSMNLL